MKRYRFYKLINGWPRYLHQNGDGFTDRKWAGVFSAEDWNTWASDIEGLHIEPIGEDEAMRRSGAPRLPGMEG